MGSGGGTGELVDGSTADEQYDEAVAAAEHAFDLLGRAYAGYYD